MPLLQYIKSICKSSNICLRSFSWISGVPYFQELVWVKPWNCNSPTIQWFPYGSEWGARQGFSGKIEGPPNYQLEYKFSFVCAKNPSQSLQDELFNSLIHLSKGFHESVPRNHSSIFCMTPFFPRTSQISESEVFQYVYKLNNPTPPGHYVEGRQYGVQYMWMSLSCSCFFYIKLDGMRNGIFFARFVARSMTGWKLL